MKKSISETGSKKPLDIKLKLVLGLGIGLIAAGVGYLGWHVYSHSNATASTYDEFPEWLTEESGEYVPSQILNQQTGMDAFEVSISNPEYSMSDSHLTDVITGISVGTEYAAITGKQASQFCIAYDVTVDSEEGWSKEPIVFTVKDSDETVRMTTKIKAGDDWQNITSGSVELEAGSTYQCIAYCSKDSLDGLTVYAMDTDYKSVELDLTE